MLPLFERARRHCERIALIDADGSWTFAQLLDAADRVAAALRGGKADLQEQRVAFLVSPGFAYAATQWGIWRAGGVAVPLGLMHPRPELAYALDDAQVSAVVTEPALTDKVLALVQARSLPLVLTHDAMGAAAVEAPVVEPGRRAMMLYTSGTTGKPKGVVTTHANIQVQVKSLVEAWAWSRDDHILHVLPLHHIHGIINVLTCALWAGAACEFLWPFDAQRVWRRIGRGDLTLFMAVPTIYAKLIAAWEDAPPPQRLTMSAGCRQMRLMVSGSAALPVRTLERWQSISGHVLLERYGMTEIGMALSNPLHGRRRPGQVGTALPGVEVRRCEALRREAAPDCPAQIEVRGAGVFLEY
jgi:malonyl-CoA/methylmalonyl-CoA synthetase